MLTITNLSLKLGNSLILNKLELHLKDNAIYGLVGQNGAGKSTFFKSILGLTKHSGSITIDNFPIENSNIGKLIEYPFFYEDLSVYKNLLIHRNYLNNETKLSIEDSLSLVGLLDKKDIKVKEMSLGMKQRLGIARSFLGKNVLYLLDEPQNGLDPIWIKKCRKIFLDMLKKRNRYSIISSHNLNELHQIADEFIFMNHGKVICTLENKKDNIYFLIKTNTDLNHIVGVKQLTKNIYVSDLSKEVIEMTIPNKRDIKIESISLEEIYEQIITLTSELQEETK